MESLSRVAFLLLATVVFQLFFSTTVVEAGKKWCVAKHGAHTVDLKKNMDWACSQKGVDCGPIQPGAACSEPDTVPSRASFAMNSYFRNHEALHDSCGFIGTGQIVDKDPSYGKCRYI